MTSSITRKYINCFLHQSRRPLGCLVAVIVLSSIAAAQNVRPDVAPLITIPSLDMPKSTEWWIYHASHDACERGSDTDQHWRSPDALITNMKRLGFTPSPKVETVRDSMGTPMAVFVIIKQDTLISYFATEELCQKVREGIHK